MKDKDFHLCAISALQWATTNETRDLPALLDLMNKDGCAYNLFCVPLPHNATYEIRLYQPIVVGTEWLGAFTPPKKKAR